MKRSICVWTVAFLIPILLFVGGAFWMASISMKLNQYEKSEGRVINLVKKGGGRMDPDRDVIYYPEIKYDYAGTEYVFQLKTGSEKPLADVGEMVVLYVNPEKPREVLINAFMYLWIGPTLIVVAGVVLLAGIAVIRLKRSS